MKRIVIQPRSSWSRNDLIELIEYRWVLYMLILRDIKLRYKQTLLGVFWVILQPLITALLFTVVFGRWLHVESNGAPYMLFAFCGLIPWLVFSQSVQRASTSLVNESNLVQKVYFPRIFLPLAGTLGVFLDYLFALATLAVLIAYFQFPLSWKICFLPLGTVIVFALSASFNILLSSLSAHYRDFKHIIPFFLQFWMYASPLAYAITAIPAKWQWVFALNPLTGTIEFFRWFLLDQQTFPFFPFTVACSVTLVLLGSSLIIFRKLEWTVADVI